MLSVFFADAARSEAHASTHSRVHAHAVAASSAQAVAGSALKASQPSGAPRFRLRAKQPGDSASGLDTTESDTEVVSGGPFAPNGTAIGGVPATHADAPAAHAVRDDYPAPAHARTPVEEALKEIESLDKQQAALRQARDAFDQALVASEIAKTEAKRLAEDVAEDIEDAETDDPVDGDTPRDRPAKADRGRKKSFSTDALKTMLSFVIGGILGKLLPQMGTILGGKGGKYAGGCGGSLFCNLCACPCGGPPRRDSHATLLPSTQSPSARASRKGTCSGLTDPPAGG